MEEDAVVDQTPCESLACKTVKGILNGLYSSELQCVWSYEDDCIEAMFCVFLANNLNQEIMSHQVDQLGVLNVCVHCQYHGKLTDSSG